MFNAKLSTVRNMKRLRICVLVSVCPSGSVTLFSASFSALALGSGRTLWNIDRSNIPTAPITRRRIDLGDEAVTRATFCVQITPEPPRARVENEAENRVQLPDGHTDTRTQILNLFIFLTVLNFALNIYILHHLVTIRFF